MKRLPWTVDEEEPQINLTPLIDVVFVILIMFIVVAPLLDLDEIALADSSQNSKEVSWDTFENHPLTIQVKKDNSIWLNDKKVEITQLKFLLKEAKKRGTSQSPVLMHDKEAFFGTYQAVKNCCEEAGFTELKILLKPS